MVLAAEKYFLFFLFFLLFLLHLVAEKLTECYKRMAPNAEGKKVPCQTEKATRNAG